MINLNERMLPDPAGIEPATPNPQSDVHLTEPWWLANDSSKHYIIINLYERMFLDPVGIKPMASSPKTAPKWVWFPPFRQRQITAQMFGYCTEDLLRSIWGQLWDNFFLFLHENICCGYSLEVPHWGASNEYPQHMFLWRTWENYPKIITKYSSLTIPLLYVL